MSDELSTAVLSAELRGIRAELTQGLAGIAKQLDLGASEMDELAGDLKALRAELGSKIGELDNRVRDLELSRAEGRGRAAALVGVSSAAVSGLTSILMKVLG